MSLATDLHMSYIVSAAILTALNASISTPVCSKALTLASIITRPSLVGELSILADESFSGWQNGMCS